MIYKVSYVVESGDLPGGIKNETNMPEVGKKVKIGPHTFEIIEVFEIMPPREDFQFLHATVRPVEDQAPAETG